MDTSCQTFWTKRQIIREVIESLILASIGILMTLVGLTCRNCIHNTRDLWVVASYTGLMWILAWKGNAYLTDYISTKISWFEYPITRLLIGIVSTIVYTLGSMYLLAVIYEYFFDRNLSYGAWYSVIITFIISLFMHGRAFLLNWRESAITAEKLKKESISARYESLKSQVNPHFLFNSLNALTNLVYEDQDKAVKFIKQLSEVYRYVLDTRDKEIVPLNSEINFMKSYTFLQQIRFGDKLIIQNTLSPDGHYIAPLALQMLVENAIKHNVVSEENPLVVKIYADDKYLVVENNLQPKTSIGESSSGLGLENISRRYEFLTDQKVEVINNGKSFIVKLPLIKD